MIRKYAVNAYGKMSLSVVGNFRNGVIKYVIIYDRRNVNQDPVCQWREEFRNMDEAVDFFNKMLKGEEEDDRY